MTFVTFGGITVGSMHRGLAWVTVATCVAATAAAGLRWLRVAQREHYLAGSSSRFAFRWWTISAVNRMAAAAAVVAGMASLWWPIAGVGTAVVVAIGPVGLSLRGRTSAVAWTRRLRSLGVAWALAEVLIVAAGILIGIASSLAVVAALAVPVLVDLVCAASAPFEDRLARRFVDRASIRLARVRPTVVGVTGSYGKTSTKNHIAHLVAGTRSVVVTPASFNNRAGVARAVNEHLADGTEVFVAEMGTYGPGEIADLCRWCPPTVAVITAIGPVHLERFGSEDRIVEAKSEITARATDVVLQVDDHRLAALADRLEAEGKRLYRCSASDLSADVCVTVATDAGMSVVVGGRQLASGLTIPIGVQPSNLACALAVALAVGVDAEVAVGRLADLPSVDHRLQAVKSPAGFELLDDTYNSNPAGGRAALAALAAVPAGGRRVVVTPGMVELGPRQREENRRFGAEIVAQGAELVIVGRTNRRALMDGARSGLPGSGLSRVPSVVCMADRPAAVEWVRAQLGPGDAVLYENDLPDHYP